MQKIGYAYATAPDGAGEAKHPALQDVTLQLEKGSFHWLTGPSGAGKTTLFRLLTLDLVPTEGDLVFDGVDVRGASRLQRAELRRRIGVVYQDFRLLPHLTVRENVELPLRITGGALTEEQASAVTDMLEWVGLTDVADARAENLSGGEQQRTAIARAVVRQPDLLVADEPTGNVDAAMAKRIMHLFTELHKHGTTVVLATHDVGLIKKHAFPIIRLEHGRLADGRKGLEEADHA